MREGETCRSSAKRQPRAGRSDAARSIAEADDDQLVWPEFANTDDDELVW
jgi:hypothetical protein